LDTKRIQTLKSDIPELARDPNIKKLEISGLVSDSNMKEP